MKRAYRRTLLFALILCLGLTPHHPAAAQKGSPARIQEFTGTLNDAADALVYDLPNLQAGDVVYAFAAGTSGGLDTYLALFSGELVQMVAEDDDSGGSFNAALQLAVAENGRYQLVVTRFDESTSGDFRLLVGINAPQVLNGRAAVGGAPFATALGPVAADMDLNLGGLAITDCSVLAQRPFLSGAELTQETTHFILHFTFEGADAVTQDYAKEVLATLEEVWTREIDELGWPAPPVDCGEGGDERYDIYLVDTFSSENVLGYTDPQGVRGDNLNSPGVEAWATYSYIAIENDFDDVPEALALMRATVAHEFHHAIQFGYDLNDVGGDWFYEASATWMETQVYPEDEDATPYIEDVFDTPDLCIGALPEDAHYELRIYAEWMLLDAIAQEFGPYAVQRLWELIADQEGMASFYALAEELHTTPQAIAENYAVRNLLRAYPLGEEFRARVRVEALVEGPGTVRPRQSGVEQLGVDYVLFTQPGVYTVEIDNPALTMTAVGVSAKQGRAEVFPLTKRSTVDTRAYPFFYLVILNTAQHADASECTMTDWTLQVTDGRGQLPTTGEPKVWVASDFAEAR